MHLVQILLPLRANDGSPFPATHYRAVRDELTERFGGMTAYTHAPAEGRWKDGDDEEVTRDEIVIFEVMAEALDRAWWRRYRAELERRFAQDALVIRATALEML
jgi:hypothetical protein